MAVRILFLASLALILSLYCATPGQSQPTGAAGGNGYNGPVLAAPGAPVAPSAPSNYNEYYASADLCDLQYNRAHDYHNDRLIRSFDRDHKKRNHHYDMQLAELSYLEKLLQLADKFLDEFEALLKEQLTLVDEAQALVAKDLERLNALRADCRNNKKNSYNNVGGSGNDHGYGNDDQCGYLDTIYGSLLEDNKFHDWERKDIELSMQLVQYDRNDYKSNLASYNDRKNRYNNKYALDGANDTYYEDRYSTGNDYKKDHYNQFASWDSAYSNKNGPKNGGGGR
jgi:hypothetical protein